MFALAGLTITATAFEAGRDASFHVRAATPVKLPIRDLGGEWIDRPGLRTKRHCVEMTRESERQAIRLAADTRDQLRRPSPKGTSSAAKPAPANNPANRSAQARLAPGGLTVLKRTSSCVSSIEGCIVYPK